jgi:hypothetical protein
MKIKKTRKSKAQEKKIFNLTGGIIIPWITKNRKTGEEKIVGVLIPQKSLKRWLDRRRKKGKIKYEVLHQGQIEFKDLHIRLYTHYFFPKRKKS